MIQYLINYNHHRIWVTVHSVQTVKFDVNVKVEPISDETSIYNVSMRTSGIHVEKALTEMISAAKSKIDSVLESISEEQKVMKFLQTKYKLCPSCGHKPCTCKSNTLKRSISG